jgi:hypothetical protein
MANPSRQRADEDVHTALPLSEVRQQCSCDSDRAKDVRLKLCSPLLVLHVLQCPNLNESRIVDQYIDFTIQTQSFLHRSIDASLVICDVELQDLDIGLFEVLDLLEIPRGGDDFVTAGENAVDELLAEA